MKAIKENNSWEVKGPIVLLGPALMNLYEQSQSRIRQVSACQGLYVSNIILLDGKLIFGFKKSNI